MGEARQASDVGPDTAESATEFDETALLVAVREKDEWACAMFVQKYAGRMLATASRLLGDPALAEDCVQESFIQALKNIDRFEQRSSIQTWLHRIAANCALMRLRTRQRKREQPLDDLMPEFDRYGYLIGPCRMSADDPATLLEREGTRATVRRAISQLPLSYRTILVLRDIEEFSTKDVAAMLEISESLAKTRLHRARTALRKMLEPLWQQGEV